jgi:hypothetical protein
MLRTDDLSRSLEPLFTAAILIDVTGEELRRKRLASSITLNVHAPMQRVTEEIV